MPSRSSWNAVRTRPKSFLDVGERLCTGRSESKGQVLATLEDFGESLVEQVRRLVVDLRRFR